MQYSSSQKHAIFSIRRSYLQQLALISRCRHQLLRQLQAAPGALCTGIADLASNHLTMDNITQELQGLLAEEHTAYMLYLRKVGHEVGKNWMLFSCKIFKFKNLDQRRLSVAVRILMYGLCCHGIVLWCMCRSHMLSQSSAAKHAWRVGMIWDEHVLVQHVLFSLTKYHCLYRCVRYMAVWDKG